MRISRILCAPLLLLGAAAGLVLDEIEWYCNLRGNA